MRIQMPLLWLRARPIPAPREKRGAVSIFGEMTLQYKSRHRPPFIAPSTRDLGTLRAIRAWAL